MYNVVIYLELISELILPPSHNIPTHSRVYLSVSDKGHNSLNPSFLAIIFRI